MTHSSPQAESTVTKISFIGNGIPDFFTNSIIFSGTLKIISGITTVVHQGEEIVVHSNKLVVFALDIRHFHVVGGWANILKFLSCENIESDKMDFGVAVLSGLRGGHLNDLAGAVLDHDESSFAESRALHGEGGGGPSISSSEIISFIGHLPIKF